MSKKSSNLEIKEMLDPKDGDANSTRRSPFRNGNTMRAILPLGMRVVVKLRRETDQTDSGLYLPEGAKEAKQESLLGEVLEVASAVDEETDEETNISGVPQGALVLIAKDAGITVPWDETLRLVETIDVLAMVEESDLC